MRADEDLYTLEELEQLPALKKLQWNKRRLSALIHCGILYAQYDTGESKHLVSISNLKKVLGYRNDMMETNKLDLKELDR